MQCLNLLKNGVECNILKPAGLRPGRKVVRAMNRTRLRHIAVLTAALFLLGGCGAVSGDAAAAAAQTAQPQIQTADTAIPSPSSSAAHYTAPPMATSEFHADAAATQGQASIDTSCVSLGYVAASAVSEKKLKFQVVCGDTKYNYDLPGDGTPACFVLQSGDGDYTFRVMENTAEDKYAELFAVKTQVNLKDEWQPFLRPSQFVNYGADSACVAKAAELAQGAADDAQVVTKIYDYIVQNITYDFEKAKTVESGYLPDPDETLASGKGICFDYAALAAAMLRSQGIPTKLITGYVSPDDIYHAWNMVWLQNTGWVTVQIEAPADTWSRIDLTFAANADGGAKVGDAAHYTERYLY